MARLHTGCLGLETSLLSIINFNWLHRPRKHKLTFATQITTEVRVFVSGHKDNTDRKRAAVVGER